VHSQKIGLTAEEQRKSIVLEFVGGDMDGGTMRSDSDHPEEARACVAYYILFAGEGPGGRVGSIGLSMVPGSKQYYTVTDRTEDDERITVRYTYDGAMEPSGGTRDRGSFHAPGS
jgi:hypothetical protein